MLTSHLIDILSLLLQEYQKHNIVGLLSEVSVALKNRRGDNPDIYINAARSLRSKAQEVLNADALRYVPASDRKFLEESAYGPFLPGRLAREVINGLASEQQRAFSSSEVQIFLDGANRTLAEISSVLRATENLRLATYQRAENEVGLSIKLPRSLICDDMGVVAEKLKYIDELLAALTEAEIGEARKPRLLTVSTSDLFAVVVAHWPEVSTILSHYKSLLQVAGHIIELKKLLSRLKALSRPERREPEPLDTMETLNKLVADVVDQTFASPTMAADEGRRNELKKIVKQSSLKLTADLANGVSITIDIENKAQFEYLSDITKKSPEELTHYIEEQQVAQAHFDLIAKDIDPLLIESATPGDPT